MKNDVIQALKLLNEKIGPNNAYEVIYQAYTFGDYDNFPKGLTVDKYKNNRLVKSEVRDIVKSNISKEYKVMQKTLKRM